MKSILALLFLTTVTPALAEGQPMSLQEFDAFVAQLDAQNSRLGANWTADDLARFHAGREKLDAILRDDPTGPLAAAWYQPATDSAGWLNYGPAVTYHIVTHKALKVDQAQMFRDFVNLQTDLALNVYAPDTPATCLSLKALRILENGPATPQEDAFLNAVLVAADSMRFSLAKDSLRRAEAVDPAFAQSFGDQLAVVQEVSAVSGIKGSMLFYAATAGLELNSPEVLDDASLDPATGGFMPPEPVTRAADELAASDMPERLKKAAPIFAFIEDARPNGPDAVLAGLCD